MICDTNLFNRELAPLFRKKVAQGAYVTKEEAPKSSKVVLPERTTLKPSKVLNLKSDLSLRNAIELNLFPSDYGIFLTQLFKGITPETTLRTALAVFKRTPEKERKILSFAWVQGDVHRQELNVATAVMSGYLPEDIPQFQPKCKLIPVWTLQEVMRKNASGEMSKQFRPNEVSKIQSHFKAAITSRAHDFVQGLEDLVRDLLANLPKTVRDRPEEFEGIQTLYPAR